MNGAGQNLAQNLLRGAAALGLFGRQVFALRSMDDEDVDQSDSLLFGKAHSGACRLADLIVADRLRWAGDVINDVCLLYREAGDMGGQAARTAKGLDVDSFDEVLGRE